MGTGIPVHNKADCSTCLQGREDRLSLILGSLLMVSWATSIPTTLQPLFQNHQWPAVLLRGTAVLRSVWQPSTTWHQFPAAPWITLAPALQSPNHPFFSPRPSFPFSSRSSFFHPSDLTPSPMCHCQSKECTAWVAPSNSHNLGWWRCVQVALLTCHKCASPAEDADDGKGCELMWVSPLCVVNTLG